MTTSINLKDLTSLGKEIEKAVSEQIISNAKKDGLKAELKGTSISISGEDAKVKKFIGSISK